MNISNKVNEIVCEVFDIEPFELNDNTMPGDIAGWDSLSEINLLITIEERFNIKFDNRGALKIRNIGHIRRLIESKLLKNTVCNI